MPLFAGPTYGMNGRLISTYDPFGHGLLAAAYQPVWLLPNHDDSSTASLPLPMSNLLSGIPDQASSYRCLFPLQALIVVLYLGNMLSPFHLRGRGLTCMSIKLLTLRMRDVLRTYSRSSRHHTPMYALVWSNLPAGFI